ncbi:butyrate kinase [candidate division KSB1 bacterium 4572_119]|nr:MAG: butyrate kinase [candidate division KSB1 bacterium 4572_119]
MAFRLLAINPGSTSTKVALFQDEILQFEETIIHSVEQLKKYENLWDQFDLRKDAVLKFLDKNGINISHLSAVVGRGGLIKPIPGGTYLVNEEMIHDAKIGVQGVHAANLGCAIAKSIADKIGVSAYVVDPIAVDEFEPLARYSGHPLIERRALSHTLNIHAVGRMAADKLAVEYEDTNFIVAHLGGGISICPLKKGRIVDVNDASSSGPFSPERTGELPLQPFIKLCFSGKFTQDEMRKLVMGKGGITAYLNTTDALEVERRINEGDAKAKEVYQAMAYQVSKEIGAMATVINGDVRAIVISGGLAKSEMLIEWIKERVNFIAEVIVMPGEFEMIALARGVLRILRNEEEAKKY